MKVDFDIELVQDDEQGIPFDAVKAGQELTVTLDESSGAGVLRCATAAGVELGVVPASAARQLQGALRVTVRSVKKRPDAPEKLAAVQARAVPAAAADAAKGGGGGSGSVAVGVGAGPQQQQQQEQQQGQQQQQPAPAARRDDPSGFAVTVSQLRRLADDRSVALTLQDARLQELLLRIDGAPDRERALEAALEQEPFRRFADSVLAALGDGEGGAGGGGGSKGVGRLPELAQG